MKFAHFMYGVAIVTGLVVTATFGYIFYLLTWDFEVVTLKEFKVPAEVIQAQPIPYTLAFEKHLDYKPATRYYVTNESKQPVEIVTSSVNRPTKEQTVSMSLPIPSTLDVGCGYRLQVDLAYQIIPSRSIPYTWISNEFCIVPEKGVK